MKCEFEARYYPVDPNKIRSLLREAKAKKVSPRENLLRLVYDIDPTIRKFMRIREGHSTTTLTVKQISDDTQIGGTREQEISIRGRYMRPLREFFAAFGLSEGILQETARETWSLNAGVCGVTHISIDWWPGLHPLVEIEGLSEAAVTETERALGLEERFKGDIAALYHHEKGWNKEQLHSIRYLSFDKYPTLLLT